MRKFTRGNINQLPFNLQLFGDINGGTRNEDTSGNPEGNEPETEVEPETEDKQFTQEQVTVMMSKEKKEGKNSILRALGYKTLEEAKRAIQKPTSNSTDTKPESKTDDKSKETERLLEEATYRAEVAEMKSECALAGVNKDSVDDVIAIVARKIKDGDEIEEVLEAMKKDSKYVGFFNQTGNNNTQGTGNRPGNGGTNQKPQSNALRLAQSAKKSMPNKSSYFSD